MWRLADLHAGWTETWHIRCWYGGAPARATHAISPPIHFRPAQGRAPRDLLPDGEDHRVLPRAAGDGDARGRDRRSAAAVVPRRHRVPDPGRVSRLQRDPLPPRAPRV